MGAGRNRRILAIRGLVVVLSLLSGSSLLIAMLGGSLSSAPVITTALPVSAGPIRDNSPVQYRGITVGRLDTIDGDAEGATLALQLDDDLAAQVPGNVEVRVLPRTLFGDQYLDLDVPDHADPQGVLAEETAINADTSERTVQLYDAYSRLYEMINELNPADLQTVLGTLADTLQDRGADLGTMIDTAAELADSAEPVFDSFGEDITTVVEVSQSLSASAPDLLNSLDDVAASSRTVVAEKDTLGAALAAGIESASVSERLLADHHDRLIDLTQATRPIGDVLARHPEVIDETLDAAQFFLDGGKRAFASGRFAIEAGLTLDRPYPYTAEDCPRYPGIDGPNCHTASSSSEETDPAGASAESQQQTGPEGLTGPVGSTRERDAMAELAPLIPGIPENHDADLDLLTLMLGPLVRGEEVVVP